MQCEKEITTKVKWVTIAKDYTKASESLLETLNNANNREKYATEFTFSVILATLNKYIPLKGLLSP